MTIPRFISRSPWNFLIHAAVLVGAMGCSSRPQEALPGKGAGGDASRPLVALVMKSLANEFFAAMAEGAKAHQAAAPERYDLIVNGMRNETDVAEQVGIVEQMVARRAAAIVIAPADSQALVPALARAREAGVLVVTIDNRLDPDALRAAGLTVPFVGPDNRAGAKLARQAVARRLQAGDEVALIEGIVTADNARQRSLGLEDAAREARLVIVDRQSGQWEMEKADGIAAALLAAHPRLRAILCANDSMALGAAAAIAAAGRGDVLLSGFDAIPAVRPLLADGRMVATVDQHGDRLAVEGIEAALAILAGAAPPKDRTTAIDLVAGPDRGAGQ
jgi:ribose transport system substrate-binding protein